jgi:hypothetical protein
VGRHSVHSGMASSRRYAWVVRRVLSFCQTQLACAGLLVLQVGVVDCAVQPGGVPMAGRRNQSTACVFGLRGVRIAVEDASPDAVSVQLTMCSDLPTLRQRARNFLDAQGAPAATDPALDVRQIELGHQHASAHVEDIVGGVRIVVVPDSGSDAHAIRKEIQARVERAATDDRCD